MPLYDNYTVRFPAAGVPSPCTRPNTSANTSGFCPRPNTSRANSNTSSRPNTTSALSSSASRVSLPFQYNNHDIKRPNKHICVPACSTGTTTLIIFTILLLQICCCVLLIEFFFLLGTAISSIRCFPALVRRGLNCCIFCIGLRVRVRVRVRIRVRTCIDVASHQSWFCRMDGWMQSAKGSRGSPLKVQLNPKIGLHQSTSDGMIYMSVDW